MGALGSPISLCSVSPAYVVVNFNASHMNQVPIYYKLHIIYAKNQLVLVTWPASTLRSRCVRCVLCIFIPARVSPC